ncbi:MAG: hypothetical protein ACI9IV_000693 [Paracoccaceae bacterium]|jgi:uncharacterized protein (DUF934 family)
MTVIVTDTGFATDDFEGVFAPCGDFAARASALDLGAQTDLSDLPDLPAGVRMIRVDFPSFSDGRGFSIARALRLRGYAGRLRARGHLIADQYAMARRSGFDEVEISDALAQRQPQKQWLARANWQAHDYQSRLRG